MSACFTNFLHLKQLLALEIDDTQDTYKEEIEQAIWNVFQTYENADFYFLEKKPFKLLLEKGRANYPIWLHEESQDYKNKLIQNKIDLAQRQKFSLFTNEIFTSYIKLGNNINHYLYKMDNCSSEKNTAEFGIPLIYSFTKDNPNKINFYPVPDKDRIVYFKLRTPGKLNSYFANIWLKEAPKLLKEAAKKYLFQYILRDYEQAVIAAAGEKEAVQNILTATSKQQEVHSITLTEF
ncbi:hypothetical protein [Bartonella sp. DGB1]|uniref:hypothetical protein n=1 Tax=Bartonella sp. DGB1 TaxID=3239807 RepID=UPI0035258D4F